MTSTKLLLPLRVPELGPHLGKLVTGTGSRPGGMVLDGIRVELVTRIMEMAGEARRFAAREERAAALEALGREAWLAAWARAAAQVAELLLERTAAAIKAEAEAVRMPPSRQRKLLPDPLEQRALGARLAASGAGLIPTLDRLAEAAQGALVATPAERAALENWQEALKAAARKLEAAWLALEQVAEEEARRFRARTQAVARWRKPLWPVVALTVVATVGAVWFGLVLGGYLPFPPWLREIWVRLPVGR